ncbi:MAG: efflux RND transporter periplasmic adaptor subunit [Gammaproteobacteria bacterium]|nr:efflux RND transporter periplasmic adaptor subunit [Gammaproteobacteria bacterium]MCW9003874.1 efflux RND transporter periplasmic adaptor subunit [Gammaproteobacteria bacterium]
MKTTLKIIIAVVIMLVMGWYFSEKTRDPLMQETALQHTEKHLNPKYVCPMHSQIIRDEEGTCPICGMDLVQVKVEAKESVKKQKKILYWVAPMDANYRRDEPGKSPMGMDLVPVYDEADDQTAEDGPVVRISPAVINNMGVRTAKIERGPLWRRIDTVASVDYDESRVSHIHLRTDGWIENLNVRSEGERIKKGDRLFNVYSPTLVNAMEEYVQSLISNNRRLINASRDRLGSLGVSDQQIKLLEKNRKVPQSVSIYAQQDGVVVSLKVREGMYVKPETEVMRLADLSRVWLLAEVFETQVDWVELGQSADVSLSYLPGRQWEGKVEYIYPTLDAKTRTLKVRLQFENPDEALKPNMYAHVSIYGGAKKDILTMPREALIRTGQEQRVILDLGDGRFAPRKVKAGIESGDWVEIIEGLNEADVVVVSGQFLIDSEASLKASLIRMQE